MPIALYDKASEKRLFEISRDQLDQLIDALEEEDEGEHDYYIDAAVCDFLDGKLDAPVVAQLRAAIGPAAAPAPAQALAAGPDVEPDEGDTEEMPIISDGSEPPGIEIEWREE